MYRKPDIGLDGRTQLRFKPASVFAGHIIRCQQSTHDRFHFCFPTFGNFARWYCFRKAGRDSLELAKP